jgi:hypothetical protein
MTGWRRSSAKRITGIPGRSRERRATDRVAADGPKRLPAFSFGSKPAVCGHDTAIYAVS